VSTETESLEEKRSRLRAEAKKREEAQKAKALENEVALLELIDKYEREIGPRGQSWDVVDATRWGEGFFVVRLGAGINFQTYADSKMGPADKHDFICPCLVHPDVETYRAARARRPAIDFEISNVLAVLYGVKLKDDEGK
jgi:hypothetical protein